MMLLIALPHDLRDISGGNERGLSAMNVPLDDMPQSMPADYFTENVGQLDNDEIRLYSTSGDMQIGFADSAVLIKIVEQQLESTTVTPIDEMLMRQASSDPGLYRGAMIRLDFEGANRVIPAGRDLLTHQTSFFIGNDPAKWRTGVRSYAEIVYENLYDGIGLVYRIGPGGLKYDFTVQPEANLSRIRMTYDGIDALDVYPESLVLNTLAGKVQDNEIFATAGGNPLSCEFARVGIRSVGFACDAWDHDQALVIDPLLWATFFGGSDGDTLATVALNSSGNPILAGSTMSTDFPATPGAFSTSYSGASDGMVAMLSTDGSSLLWATYIGGFVDEGVSSIALDAMGNVVMTGTTASPDFPTTPGAHQQALSFPNDAFVTKLGADGSSLIWSTYLGAGGDETAYEIALDSSGNAVVVGMTSSTSAFATAGAYDITQNGLDDAFLAKLSADGSSLMWATYLGGDSIDVALAVALDGSGNVVVCGQTSSRNFPVTPGAYDETMNAEFDAYLAKISADGSSLLWATFLGGSGFNDFAWDIVLDGSGNPVVAGFTDSPDFPVTPGAYDTSYGGGFDAFVAKMSSDGSTLAWATYLGGSGDERAYAIALGSSGNPFVTGRTDSTDFPTTPGAYDRTYDGDNDTYVAKLNAGGSSLAAATYLGGANYDEGRDITLDAVGNPVVVGGTISTDFPTTAGAYSPTYNGGFEDGFVVKLNLPDTAPVISITFPTVGSIFEWGTSPTVTWTSSDPEDPLASLIFWINYTSSAGNGVICGKIIGVLSCNWPLPTITATDVVVNGTVIDTGGLKGYGESGQFTIRGPNTPPTVAITSPIGGEKWVKGTSHAITWTMHDKEDANASLTIYINYTSGGVTGQVAAALKGQQSYAWTLPNIVASDIVVNITIIDTGGLKNWSQSGQLSIKAPNTRPTTNVTSPSGGEVWTQGGSYTVTWTASDNEDAPSALRVWINYTSSAKSGNICGPVAGNVTSCAWTLPSIAATDVVVNITVIDTGGLKNWSQSARFTIEAQQTSDFWSQYWWILVILIIVAVIVIQLLLLMRERKPKEEEESQPSKLQSPPKKEKK